MLYSFVFADEPAEFGSSQRCGRLDLIDIPTLRAVILCYSAQSVSELVHAGSACMEW